jgi:hypothetical protein
MGSPEWPFTHFIVSRPDWKCGTSGSQMSRLATGSFWLFFQPDAIHFTYHLSRQQLTT